MSVRIICTGICTSIECNFHSNTNHSLLAWRFIETSNSSPPLLFTIYTRRTVRPIICFSCLLTRDCNVEICVLFALVVYRTCIPLVCVTRIIKREQLKRLRPVDRRPNKHTSRLLVLFVNYCVRFIALLKSGLPFRFLSFSSSNYLTFTMKKLFLRETEAKPWIIHADAYFS